MWSSASMIMLRGANLLVGIVIARLMSPEQFGVWAVALTVQTVLVTLADLGLSADVVRTERLEQRLPTIATVALVASAVMTIAMAASSSLLANSLNSPDAAPVILLMSFTLLLSGAGVVPLGLLQRRIQQKQIFAASSADFVVGTVITVGLILVGFGPIALAISRIAAQSVSTVLLFALAKVRPHFGFQRSEAIPALRFGIPVAAANLLSWALLNVDNVVIARVLGASALGYYVLAFNVSSWPMTIIGQAVRSVSLAAFSHVSRTSLQTKGKRDPSLSVGAALSWGIAVPAGVLLAALSEPLIQFLYGPKWLPGATVLAALGYFGILRVLYDIMATYLMASGRSMQVLIIQIVWMISLIPVIVVAVERFGIAGAAYAHLITGVVVVGPIYIWLLHRSGADTKKTLKVLIVPTLAAVPMWLVATTVAAQISTPITALLAGGLGGLAVYILLVYRWAQNQRSAGRQFEASIAPMNAEVV